VKIYQVKTLDVRKDTIPADHKEKISLLRLAKVGVYIEGVGMRDEEFFLVAEDANDNLYLSFITAWKLVAYDEDDNEIVVDVHRNHVANLIDDFLTESFGEESDDE
jgi:hypothetical protein